MSRADYSFDGDPEVDLDRLADYTAGVLEPADAAEVENLVATDARWAQLYAAMVSADDLIRDALRAEATARIEPMPADVVARIDDALGAVAPPERDASSSVTVVSIVDRGSRRRRILAGIAGGVAAAAALIVGFNINAGIVARDSATNSMGGAESAPMPALDSLTAPPLTVPVIASGTDYARDTLGGFGRQFSYDATPAPSFEVPQSTSTMPPRLPVVPNGVEDSAEKTALGRLTDPAALTECLNAILLAQPGRVAAVDFARFEGQPALVVLVLTSARAVVVAAGPECGRGGADIKATSER